MSINWISTIGRAPANAKPTPVPVMACSEIGVSLTRELPNFSFSPVETPKTLEIESSTLAALATFAGDGDGGEAKLQRCRFLRAAKESTWLRSEHHRATGEDRAEIGFSNHA